MCYNGSDPLRDSYYNMHLFLSTSSFATKYIQGMDIHAWIMGDSVLDIIDIFKLYSIL